MTEQPIKTGEAYHKAQRELWLKSLILTCDSLIVDIDKLRDHCCDCLDDTSKADAFHVECLITSIRSDGNKLYKLNDILKY